MKSPKFSEISPVSKLLMGPGPSNVAPSVLKALAKPLLGHLDPSFLSIVDEVQVMLRYLFGTENQTTYPVSGTGSAGMETAFVNLIEPGETVLVCENGVFGRRMIDLAGRCGAQVNTIAKPWGQVFSPREVEEAISKYKPKIVSIVHAETSTGVLQPLEEICALINASGVFSIVDTVTSLGGSQLYVDEWAIDVAYSGTQKCLSCPPGLAPITFSDRALNKIKNRKTAVQSWYFDVNLIQNYFGAKRSYHHTAPVSMIYGLHEALRLICEEGVEACVARHKKNHLILKKSLESLGLRYLPKAEVILPQLNAVAIPDGVDDKTVRKRLLTEFGIEIGGGLGEFAGKAWRIGLMGVNSNECSVSTLVAALKKTL